MFRLFPSGRTKWLQAVFLFPFQAYPIVAWLMWAFLTTNCPRHYHHLALSKFERILSYGFTACFLVLVCLALATFDRRRPVVGLANTGLAVFSLFWSMAVMSYLES